VNHTEKNTWGGERRGAGRKRALPEKDRQSIAFTYYLRMQRISVEDSGELINADDMRLVRSGWFQPRREAVIRRLANEKYLTRRMIERIIAEFLPVIRREVETVSGIDELGRISDKNLSRFKMALKFHKLILNKKRRTFTVKYLFPES
jgi:hypothetical protein